MNTPLYSTKTRKPKTDIEYVDYNSIEEIINDLFLASTLPHDEYDSVKLYGDSKFILSVFRHIISNEKYSDITIASVDIISSAMIQLVGTTMCLFYMMANYIFSHHGMINMIVLLRTMQNLRFVNTESQDIYCATWSKAILL